MGAEKKVAREADLKAHIAADWKTVHGVWNSIRALDAQQVPARFRAYVNSAQDNLTAAAWTKLALDAETYDVGSCYDHATNYRFTAPVAGYYHFDAANEWSTRTASATYEIALYVDGAAVAIKRFSTNSEGDHQCMMVSDTLYLTAGQYVEVFVKSNNASTNDIQTGSAYSYFSGHILSRA